MSKKQSKNDREMDEQAYDDKLLTTQLDEVQRFTDLLPNIIGDEVPRVSKVVLVSALFFGLAGLVYSLSCFDVFTPTNSNAYCFI
jgi:hypothetical protein